MYNFICLLNIPSVIQKYGPIRIIWEGAKQGEGYIRVIKPELSLCLQNNWHMSKMKKLVQQDALTLLMKKHGIEYRLTEERKQQSSDYHFYPSLHSVHQKR